VGEGKEIKGYELHELFPIQKIMFTFLSKILVGRFLLERRKCSRHYQKINKYK
jgi:hypothetical protein